MLTTKKYTILFVDDDKESRIGFNKAFGKTFNVLTATSPKEAEKILEKKSSEISVLISDHKMNGEILGLDFLKKCTNIYPDIIRILTTGYSNHDLAIEAVNSGVLYKYILKPWDLETFTQIVSRAADYFAIQKERNFLAQERIVVLQQLILTDRLRNLVILSEGLSGHINNPLLALKKFMEFMPKEILSDKIDICLESLENSLNLAREKNQNFLNLIKSIRTTVVRKNSDFETCILSNLIEKEIEAASEQYDLDIQFEPNSSLPKLKADVKMVSESLKVLLRYLNEIECKKISIAGKTFSTEITEGIKISFLFNAIQRIKNIWDLMPVFFAVYHHNGDIIIEETKIEINLPINPDSVVVTEKINKRLWDDFFAQFEALKHYETWMEVIR